MIIFDVIHEMHVTIEYWEGERNVTTYVLDESGTVEGKGTHRNKEDAYAWLWNYLGATRADW